MVLAMLIGSALFGGEPILVIEQDYSIIGQSKDGVNAKDIRQRLYVHKDWLAIDEIGGSGKDGKPTETVILDLKNQKIINLYHTTKTMDTEDFESRRARIKRRETNAKEDLDAQLPGPQRDRVERLFWALLDADRKFKLTKEGNKTIAGVNCHSVKILAEEKAGYVALDATLHPDMELPYENAEVLYLLQIIGGKLSDFLKKNHETFKRVPMELHLDLAAGGTLDTKVVSVMKINKENVDVKVRGGLGSPFELPADYKETAKTLTKPKPPETRPD